MRENKKKNAKKHQVVEDLEYTVLEKIAELKLKKLVDSKSLLDTDEKEIISVLKNEGIYNSLLNKYERNEKEKNTKKISSIIIRTITVNGFYFAIIAFLLNIVELSIWKDIFLAMFFTSILITILLNCLIIPILYAGNLKYTDTIELVANLVIAQSVIFFYLYMVNISNVLLNISTWEFLLSFALPFFAFVILVLIASKRRRNKIEKSESSSLKIPSIKTEIKQTSTQNSKKQKNKSEKKIAQNTRQNFK